MGFSIRKADTFKRTVTVQIPQGDGTRTETFVAEFRSLSREQIEGRGDGDLLADALVGVADVNDENGQPLPPDVARAAVLNDLCASQAAVLAFLAAVKQEAPKAKTSRR